VLNGARAIEQRHDSLLLGRQSDTRSCEALAIDGEDEIQRWNLLLDETPFVDSARGLEQETVRTDRDRGLAFVGSLARLEEEGATRPGEEMEDSLFDLQHDVAVELLLRQQTLIDEHLAEPAVRPAGLLTEHCFEPVGREQSIADQQIAQAVATVDDARERHPAALEEDLAQPRAVGHRQAAALHAEREKLHHVGQTCLGETALDRHGSVQLPDDPVLQVRPRPEHLVT
jgi:hypothetical protein